MVDEVVQIQVKREFHQLMEKGPGQRWHLPALPTTLARLALRAQASRKEKRPHTSSAQPLSLV